MKKETAVDFCAVSQQMKRDLNRIGKWRRIVRLLICIVYPMALIWFAFAICGNSVVNMTDYDISTTTTKYVILFFIIFVVFNALSTLSMTKLKKKEDTVMGMVIKSLFPEATYYPDRDADTVEIRESRMFGTAHALNDALQVASFGSLTIPTRHHTMTIADIGVMPVDEREMTIWKSFLPLFQSIFRPLLGTQVESSMYSFRGMFGYCRLQRDFHGFVMLVPDNLEDKLGYLAQRIQKLRETREIKFIYLEDPEFERLFTVYADDEVKARMILTPDLMRKLTELRRSFSHDLMISFSRDTFYYASNMPRGFLRLSRKAQPNENLLADIYREVELCLSVEWLVEHKYGQSEKHRKISIS